MDGPTPDPDTSDFIVITVNQDVSSWIDGSGNKKKVMICNYTACVTWQYLSNGHFVSVAATPAVPVAVNVTAVSVPVEALKAFGPAVVPSVQATVAIPEPSV